MKDHGVVTHSYDYNPFLLGGGGGSGGEGDGGHYEFKFFLGGGGGSHILTKNIKGRPECFKFMLIPSSNNFARNSGK